MTNHLIDGLEREQATDPTESFIVQAPAGSGKTEILTQRYLRLLSLVQTPEQIIAITFTRKAAQEMRARILKALQNVADGMQPQTEHQRVTARFAKAALDRDKTLAWNILQQASRMRIMTIDALCQMLTRAVSQPAQPPLANHIQERPQGLYLDAARACFGQAAEDPVYQEALKTLLKHLDNKQEHLIGLFTDLLSQRDQWLPVLYQAKQQKKEVFEHALALIEQHELSRFKNTLPFELTTQLIELCRRVALIENNPESPRAALQTWYHKDELTSDIAASLAAMLFTSQNALRKSLDHHVGLRKDACRTDEYAQIKDASKKLFEQLNACPDFIEALLRVRHLPDPRFEEKQWQVLQALFTLLPALVAHAQIVFSQKQAVDFTAIAERALHALGHEDEPTDLALYLDHHIQHLLIDEFQDTSLPQYKLLSQLVQGWEPHDGRTLFVVGDPMQSIYRFRGAEVGLFLRAREQGIGPVELMPLELRCNFRSTATLVKWVNFQFQSIFPAQDDMESGAISYLSAQATQQTPSEDSFIKASQTDSKAHEACAIVRTIQQELNTYPDDSIAILVRSRHQLSLLITQLKQAQIPFQAVDLDKLAHLPHIRDVWNLTQALLMPANRLVWLAFLRSPWCGLALPDLHTIASVDRKKSIYHALETLQSASLLSEDGQKRITYLFVVLHNALTKRHQQRLQHWIRDTLTSLHAQRVLTPAQQNDLESFWMLLDKHDKAGYISDFDLFNDELNQLYSKHVTPAKVHIMTIHKSKGLEFDTVICPGLSAKQSPPDQPLIKWLQLPSEKHGDIFLLSPIKATGDRPDPVYHYLSQMDDQKNHYEQQRLLYVALTRAKKRLYLWDHQETLRSGSFKALLNKQCFESEPGVESDEDHTQAALPVLTHLPIDYYQQPPTASSIGLASSIPMQSNAPRLLGTIAHEILQWICTYHPSSADDIPWTLASRRLQQTGLPREEQESIYQQIKQQITQFFIDPVGQWIRHAHSYEKNEYACLVCENNEIKTKVIDRTFVEHQVRWIIDFKTGRDEQEQLENNQAQVNAYAELFAKQGESLIRCGLYYLATSRWVVWDYVVQETEPCALANGV